MESQNKMIKKHLEKGQPITPIDALNMFGCFRLGARIHDLKEQGLPIITEMVSNGRKRFAQYKLIKS